MMQVNKILPGGTQGPSYPADDLVITRSQGISSYVIFDFVLLEYFDPTHQIV